VVCADVHLERAQTLAAQYPGARASSEAKSAIEDPEVEAVIISTSHDMLAGAALGAIEAGKHVLVEKPVGRSSREVEPLVRAAQQHGVIVKAGFNHRFHPALLRARQIVDDGGIGDLMYIRGRYGHGGRLGYEREWRADPRLSGGGELLDQGSHLIDLSRWFAGDVVGVSGHAATFFWPMQVEDNAFVSLTFAQGRLAWLHASWTEWKNLFSFEIFGRVGKLQIDGLGGSYGVERLIFYRMLPEMGPPETTSWEYAGPDMSWQAEFEHFAACVDSGRIPSGSLEDALANLKVVETFYTGAHG
jgi:predicted dehydrogenase